jgi:hypothetical protein
MWEGEHLARTLRHCTVAQNVHSERDENSTYIMACAKPIGGNSQHIRFFVVKSFVSYGSYYSGHCLDGPALCVEGRYDESRRWITTTAIERKDQSWYWSIHDYNNNDPQTRRYDDNVWDRRDDTKGIIPKFISFCMEQNPDHYRGYTFR